MGGVLPQAAPQCVSYALYRWEVNIRAATILRFVGAGGLGQRIHVGEAKSDEVPRALRCWFVAHGVVDWMFVPVP